MRTHRALAVLVALGVAGVLGFAACKPPPPSPPGPPPAKPTRFGVHANSAIRPDGVMYASDLGAGWIRSNAGLDDVNETQKFTKYLDAKINVVITIGNREGSNVDTTYGTRGQYPRAGFPYVDRDRFIARIRAELKPLAPYLDRGRQIWVQSENEVGDASITPNSVYWRGTTSQYLAQLDALNDAVKGLDRRMAVVQQGFASPALAAAVDPSSPTHGYQTLRITKLLTEGHYDAADLHFYGCADTIGPEARWVKDHLPAGKQWISTESGGPTPECANQPTWQRNFSAFEAAEARDIPARLGACADNGGAICLWFTLFDPKNEVAAFNHIGLIDGQVSPPREKPAYGAFKQFAATHI